VLNQHAQNREAYVAPPLFLVHCPAFVLVTQCYNSGYTECNDYFGCVLKFFANFPEKRLKLLARTRIILYDTRRINEVLVVEPRWSFPLSQSYAG
jgi:hypothetical protein